VTRLEWAGVDSSISRWHDTYTHAKNILFLLPMFISKVDV
jgi:hypothetical protein